MMKEFDPSLCPVCEEPCVYYAVCDAWWCSVCDAWTELPCCDPDCDFCVHRNDDLGF